MRAVGCLPFLCPAEGFCGPLAPGTVPARALRSKASGLTFSRSAASARVSVIIYQTSGK